MISGPVRKTVCGKRGIQGRATPANILTHVRLHGPIRGLIRRQTAALQRIDAKGEELIEGSIERPHARETRLQKIPIERFQVPKIKYDPVPLRDRSLVQLIRPEHFEELVGLLAGVAYTPQERVTERGIVGRGKHENPFTIPKATGASVLPA